MLRFSANLGFLWTDRPLIDAILAAKAAGFAAVECHWPYDVPAAEVGKALRGTGLPMLGLNTVRGDATAGENGLAALPGRLVEARAAIDQALGYAQAVGAGNVHVMAGNSAGAEAEAIFAENLRYASAAAGPDRVILIEPLNPWDAPGYFLRTTDQAAKIIDQIGAPNLKLMFDCYHVARTEGDVLARLEALLPIIGHIQFAGVQDRGRPDAGALDYAEVFERVAALGWQTPLGAEYRPDGPTEETLGWMESLRSS